MVSGDEPEWTVAIRQPELIVVRRKQPVATYSDVVGEVLFETISNVPFLSAYLRITSPIFKKYLDDKKTS